MNPKTISKVMSEMAKLSHQKSPRTKEFYRAISKKALEKRWGKKSYPQNPPRKTLRDSLPHDKL